jgi:hypothetical protein
MNTFTRAYISCALWSSTDWSRNDGGDPLEDNYSIDDFAQETVDTIMGECEAFQAQNAGTLYGLDEEQAGHDFWLTRNRHGCGFWDGDYPEPASTLLTNAAQAFGVVSLCVGDDGQIYQFGG